MANEYETIDNLEKQQNNYLDQAMTTQQDIINKKTQMNIDTLQRQKEEVDKDATKTNRALYTEYRKANNPYGANAEQLASRGLGNSGYAETTQTNLYNTYQKNVTDTLNNARNLKSDFDSQMSQARQNGDIAMAQNAKDIYLQKMQLLTQNYELRNNREQFLYQQNRDKVADSQWQKQYEYQQNRDAVADRQWQQQFDTSNSQWNQNFTYQQSRDKVADSQWQKQYEYQQNRDAIADNQWQQQFDVSNSQWNQNFAYQQNRDAVADQQWQQNYDAQQEQNAIANNQWQQQYAYQQGRDKVSDSQWNQTFKYQQSRDKVADSQWEKEYQLSKKAKASSSRSSSGRSSSSKSSNGTTSGIKISKDDDENNNDNSNNGNSGTTTSQTKYSGQDILSNMKFIQGPTQNGSGVQKVVDGISGKIFSSPAELLKYYGL